MKKVVFIVMASLLCLFVAYGAMAEASKEKAAKDKYIVGVSVYGLGVSWRIQMMEEFYYEASKHEDVIGEIIVTNAEMDNTKQISDIEDLISKNVDILLIDPGSPKAMVPVTERAYDEGMVVITFNNEVDTDMVTSKVILDQAKFGKIQGEWLADALGGEGKVVMLSGLKGSTVSDDRDRGAKDVYDTYPGIEVVQIVYASWAYGDAKRAMESIIASYPDIDGISSQGGAMSQAAIDSYLERGMEPPLVTAEDSNGFLKQWKNLRDSGDYPNFSSVAPGMPPWMIAEALKLGLKAVEGEDVPKVYEVDAPVITEDTLDDYVREDLPDSYWCNSRLPEEKINEIFSR